MKSYEQLHLLPHVIARAVCERPYTGQEFTPGMCPGDVIKKIEVLRQAMTLERVAVFVDCVDARCRQAYQAESPWFLKCVRARGNRGRDQLYVWITHWLAAFLST
jgi:hypothetical protein